MRRTVDLTLHENPKSASTTLIDGVGDPIDDPACPLLGETHRLVCDRQFKADPTAHKNHLQTFHAEAAPKPKNKRSPSQLFDTTLFTFKPKDIVTYTSCIHPSFPNK